MAGRSNTMNRRQRVVYRTRRVFNKIKKNRRVRRALTVAEDLSATIARVVSTPSFVLVALITSSVIYAHIDDKENSVVLRTLSDYSSVPGAKWAYDNIDKFLGILIMMPTIISARSSVRLTMGVALVSSILILPLMKLFEYVMLSALVLLYMKVSTKEAKLLTIAAGVVLVFYNYKALSSASSGGTTTTTTTRPKPTSLRQP